jgi:hypothetical protein
VEYHVLAGGTGVLIEFISMVPYFADIFRGRTKPHVFTWLGWGLVNTVVGTAQFVSGAGAGVLVTAMIGLTCYSVAILALFYGERNIVKSDWACLIGSIIAISLWALVRDPLIAVLIVCIADVLAFMPTFRKAFSKPHEETLSSFVLGGVRDVFAISALQSLDLVNWLYPATLLVSDSTFAAMLFIRRRQLAETTRFFT